MVRNYKKSLLTVFTLDLFLYPILLWEKYATKLYVSTLFIIFTTVTCCFHSNLFLDHQTHLLPQTPIFLVLSLRGSSNRHLILSKLESEARNHLWFWCKLWGKSTEKYLKNFMAYFMAYLLIVMQFIIYIFNWKNCIKKHILLYSIYIVVISY